MYSLSRFLLKITFNYTGIEWSVGGVSVTMLKVYMFTHGLIGFDRKDKNIAGPPLYLLTLQQAQKSYFLSLTYRKKEDVRIAINIVSFFSFFNA